MPEKNATRDVVIILISISVALVVWTLSMWMMASMMGNMMASGMAGGMMGERDVHGRPACTGGNLDHSGSRATSRQIATSL